MWVWVYFITKEGGGVHTYDHIKLSFKRGEGPQMCPYSSRQKKVPTTYRLFNVVDKKTAGFKRSFTSVDVVSA